MNKPMGPGRTLQMDASIVIDDGFFNLFKVPIFKTTQFIRPVEKGFRRAVVVGVRSIKGKITTMRAVGAGFMRKSVVGTVRAYSTSPYITATFGTMAWYDILVHEGLGRHGSGDGKLPSQYMPNKMQLAIVEPDAKARFKFYKRSPKKLRPFLTQGIAAAKTAMSDEINKGVMEGLKAIGSRRGKPRHNFEAVLKSGGIV